MYRNAPPVACRLYETGQRHSGTANNFVFGVCEWVSGFWVRWIFNKPIRAQGGQTPKKIFESSYRCELIAAPFTKYGSLDSVCSAQKEASRLQDLWGSSRNSVTHLPHQSLDPQAVSDTSVKKTEWTVPAFRFAAIHRVTDHARNRKWSMPQI